MQDQSKPILEIKKFGYADSVRTHKKRVPGMCTTLKNLSPSLSDGERIRRGFASYTTITPPTGTQKFFILPVQSPAQDDVALWMATSGVYLNPYYFGSTRQASNIKIDETISNGTIFNNGDTTFGTNTITVANAGSHSFSTTSGYYQGWVIYNSTQGQYQFVKSYVVTTGTGVFTLDYLINGSGLNWSTANSYTMYRNFHDNLGFTPSYNNNYTSPPFALADISRLYFSGGQSSASGNVALWSGYINQAFFPTDSTYGYTYTGTYVSEERLRALTRNNLLGSASQPITPTAGGATSLERLKTYWIGIAAVYDGFQLGEIRGIETYATDYGSAGDWTNNYFGAGSDVYNGLSFRLKVIPALLNKRITAFHLFMAQDSGDTRAKGRQTPYFSIGRVSITSTNPSDFPFGGTWAHNGSDDDSMGMLLQIFGDSWIGRGVSYIDASGMEETPPDTSYSYSSRLVLNDKHYISNVYIASEGVTNREEIFTNPRGGLAGVNSGINQPSLFPNDQGFFRKGIELAIGTKINCMAKVGLGELLTIKDRGLILNRIIEEIDGTIQLISQILDQNIGCSTLNGFTQLDADEGGLIFFAGYDDIYLYDNARFKRLIERADQQDWLYQYREVISKSAKEAITMVYLPEGVLFLDINQTTGQQFHLYTQYLPNGWRQATLKESSGSSSLFFSQFAKLQNGTALGLSTEGTPALYQFSNPTTGAYYYTDAGTAILYRMDTGDMVTSGSENFDTVFNRCDISRTFDSPTSGTLDIDLYKDGAFFKHYLSQQKSTGYLRINSFTDDARIANTWRLDINNNSSPEVLSGGTIFQIDGLFFYGEIRPRARRSSDVAGTTSSLGGCMSNTIQNVQEIIVNETPATYTFDIPFTKTYTSPSEGSVPAYRFEFEPPYIVGSDKSTTEEIVITAKTLTSITLKASSDNTLVKFIAVE